MRVYSERNQRIFVGMSGGVDSSVSAALLKEAGYEVVGVFIKIEIGGNCGWREERREARRAAAHLDIPLITLDLSREYKKRVVDYFIAEYKAGRTPNPDVMCNKHIKFGVFYDWAMSHKADFVATGHYAINRCEYTNNANATNKKNRLCPNSSNSYVDSYHWYRNCQLCVSTDNNKDQTYFLWNLKQNQLPHILFPVGDKTKKEVRTLAKKFGLPNALKKDSQGLCFVGQIDFKDFLKRELAEKEGGVLDEQGKIIGRHSGATFFTLGERHGFEIFAQSPNSQPYYIVAKDIKKNTITVSQTLHLTKAEKLEVKIEKTNWIAKMSPEDGPLGAVQGPSSGRQLLARVRYRQPLQKCQISQIDNQKGTATILFDQPQLAVAGQSLVLYHQDICLGGGVIV